MSDFLAYVGSLLNQFLLVMKGFRFVDVLDILAVALIIFSIVRFVRQTRAKQLVGGIVVLLLIWLISELLGMTVLSVVMKAVVDSGIIVLVIVFQPELRNALEMVSRPNFSLTKKWPEANAVLSDCIDQVCDACEVMHLSKTGALIVFERQTMLEDIVKTGTVIDADARKELICNVFFPKTPLHDGAMIMRNGRICAAGCILPLSQNMLISKDLGTRHRAALGISENSDAMVIVVSEETGTISVAERGGLRRNYTKEELRTRLRGALLPEETDNSLLSSIRERIKKGGKKHE